MIHRIKITTDLGKKHWVQQEADKAKNALYTVLADLQSTKAVKTEVGELLVLHNQGYELTVEKDK